MLSCFEPFKASSYIIPVLTGPNTAEMLRVALQKEWNQEADPSLRQADTQAEQADTKLILASLKGQSLISLPESKIASDM